MGYDINQNSQDDDQDVKMEGVKTESNAAAVEVETSSEDNLENEIAKVIESELV